MTRPEADAKRRNDPRVPQEPQPRAVVVTTVALTIEAFLLPHIRALRSAGWHVEIATSPPSTARMTMLGVPIWFLPLAREPRRVAQHLRSLVAGRRLLRRGNYDVVYVHTPIAAATVRIATATLPRSIRPAIVYFAHGFHFHAKEQRTPGEWGWYTLERALSRLTDCLIVINETDEESARPWRISRRGRVIRVLGVGIDPDQYSTGAAAGDCRSVALPDGPTQWVGCIAEFNENKRQDLVIAALERLPSEVGIAFAGDGPTRAALEAVASSRGLSGRTAFLGHVDDVRPLLAAVDAVVLASKREGLPRSLMEALCMGVPVAVTQTRGAVDIAKAANCPVAETDTPEGLAAAIGRALESSRSRNEVRATFLGAWRNGLQEEVAETVIEIFDGLARKQHKRARWP